MKEFDLIIAGGGMVGSTAALALSKLGLSIAVVESSPPEQSTNTSFDQRAVALSAASVRIFKSLNIWDSIKSLAEPIKHIHISDQGHFGFARLNAEDYQVDALGEVVPLDETGPILWQHLQQTSNIELFSQFELTSVDQEQKQDKGQDNSNLQQATNQQVVVTIENKGEQRKQQLVTKLLIGADGIFSTVAKLAAIETSHKNYQQHAIIANITTEKSHQNRAYERFTPSGPLALLPLTGNRLSLVWCKHPEQMAELMKCDVDQFQQQLQQAFGFRLGQITKVGERNQYPLSLRVAKQPFKAGVLLLGNAAHTLHPIAGQGFNIGIRDIAALVDCIEQTLLNKKRNFGSVSFLQQYQQSRQQDWDKTINATDWLVRLFSHDFLPVVAARNKALSLFDKIPLLKQHLAASAMGLTGRSAKMTRGVQQKVTTDSGKGL